MKKLHVVGKAVLVLAFAVSVSSCSTYSTNETQSLYDESGPQFQDEASVNAVLQFSSWEYTFLVRPQYAEGGYLQQVHPETIRTVMDQLNVRRGTVAVVVGWTYNGDVLNRVVADWKNILGGCGFQRVVILRAQFGNKLNGSVIIDDSTLHVGSVQSPARGG